MHMEFLKKNIHKTLLLVFSSTLPIFSFAQGNIPQPCDVSGKICNPIPYNTLNAFIKVLLEGVLKIGIPIVALAVIYCGFLFVQAQGKPEDITRAKDALMYTLIGAAILLGSWAIATLISNTVLAL